MVTRTINRTEATIFDTPKEAHRVKTSLNPRIDFSIVRATLDSGFLIEFVSMGNFFYIVKGA